jgi:hypothetical protein
MVIGVVGRIDAGQHDRRIRIRRRTCSRIQIAGRIKYDRPGRYTRSQRVGMTHVHRPVPPGVAVRVKSISKTASDPSES